MKAMIKQELEQIVAVMSDINEEIESACEEYATAKQIDDIKALTSQILSKYSNLLEGVGPEEKAEVIRDIGLKIAELEGKLSQLQEAPE